MRTIWKYPIGSGGAVAMPAGSKVLSTAFQGDDLQVWAEVTDTPGMTHELHRFEIYGTGHEIPTPNDLSERIFIGTAFHRAGLVFHVFERR